MTSTTTEYSTWPRRVPAHPNSLERKAVLVHGMSDPLGAKGFRQSRERIEREGKARRLAAIGAIATFVASLVLIVRDGSHSTPINDTSGIQQAPVGSQSQTTGLGARAPGLEEQIQVQVPAQSHTRTRSSD
jgi:hypothetical protein